MGEAQSSAPNNEDFCGFNALGFPHSANVCRPFVWHNGAIAELPNTLGGANGVANLINDFGEVVGFAETNRAEPSCPVNQFVPVVWQKGKMRALPTYANDPDGSVFSINLKGQAVGSSGSCVPFNPNSQLYLFESHAVLWDADGSVHNLGTLGGTGAFAGNHACSINNFGEVVGHSDASGDTTTYGFLWTEQTGMRPLYPLAGDFASLAIGINDKGDVVGSSFYLNSDANFVFRAVLWHNGSPLELNTLVRGGSPLYLQIANSIDLGGAIVGFGQTSTGEIHGFLATPAVSDDSPEEIVTPRIPSEHGRKMLLRKVGIRGR